MAKITIEIPDTILDEITRANQAWQEYRTLDSKPNSPRLLQRKNILHERLMWQYKYIGEHICEALDTTATDSDGNESDVD